MFFVNSRKTESQIANVDPGLASTLTVILKVLTALINLNRFIFNISIQSENGRIWVRRAGLTGRRLQLGGIKLSVKEV